MKNRLGHHLSKFFEADRAVPITIKQLEGHPVESIRATESSLDGKELIKRYFVIFILVKDPGKESESVLIVIIFWQQLQISDHQVLGRHQHLAGLSGAGKLLENGKQLKLQSFTSHFNDLHRKLGVQCKHLG